MLCRHFGVAEGAPEQENLAGCGADLYDER
jgi:hypothetical protein